MLNSILAISIGASSGAVLRWLLGLGLNALNPALPMGTLAANLIGGYLIGVAVAFFGQSAGVPPEWRLFVVTGFLGGLTTFSSFSAEIVALLQHGRWALAAGGIALHLIGSLGMTLLGLASYAWLKG